MKNSKSVIEISESGEMFTVNTGEEVRKFDDYPEARDYAWNLSVETNQFVHSPIEKTRWPKSDSGASFGSNIIDGKLIWDIALQDYYRCFEIMSDGVAFFDEAAERSCTDQGRDLNLADLMEDYDPAEQPAQ